MRHITSKRSRRIRLSCKDLERMGATSSAVELLRSSNKFFVRKCLYGFYEVRGAISFIAKDAGELIRRLNYIAESLEEVA